LQTVPIVAIAPLIVIWIGEGFLAVVAIAFLVSLFPIITNATDGLVNIRPALADLFRLNRASRWQTLVLLRLPASLPNLVTGLKISSGTSVLGAIVGEFFAGAGADHPGLGYLIFAAKGQFRLDFLFAAIITCTLLGIAIFSAVDTIGRHWLLYWHHD
jgi:NitT/TauT family transport system permease protein